MYSNESERANYDIYDIFKLKKPFVLHNLYKNMSALKGLEQVDTSKHVDFQSLSIHKQVGTVSRSAA